MVKLNLILLCLLCCFFASAQDTIPKNDTTLTKKDKWAAYEHKPKRSVLWSLLPGAGQIYNEVGYRKVSNKKHRAWWKVPLIYGGLGVCGYYLLDNYSNAKLLKEEVNYRREFGDSTNLHASLAHYETESSLINGYVGFDGTTHQGFDLRAKRRDLFIFACVGVYALNLIEAYVDGHFVSFDVSDDLSMRFMPIMYNAYSPGLSLQFNFN